ncbi:DUF1178 family protein [Hyphomicrobium sp.]|uniref:DUF1178 family protein n=1 Tax=Hyphomicrobium sp. TaxID=82 RepID=UPI0025C6C6AB|nr:DUF1178 family protein [Hyphomicrobium sp.]MCC7251387.1 DUF1178 family protein [Hyphomicrobium sp.]
MIKFSLVCRKGHEFEAWFKSGAAYEAQTARAQVVCPHCGSHDVDKAIMAPAVATRIASMPAGEPQPPPSVHDRALFLRQVRDEIHAKAEYVGGRFAEEARRIHFNESAPRGIYGEATADEVKELAEDGVPFFPVPRLPEDFN